VANDGEFQEQVRQLGKLVGQFDELPDSAVKVAGKEMVQLLMDVHGTGLERIMEIIFESGNLAPGIIDQLGQDPIVGSLLLLYSLHPDDVETRVQKAIARIGPRLRKLSCAIELVSVRENAVKVRLATSAHSCGSSTNDLRAIVEDGVYEFAPDVTSLEIIGLEQPTSSGFVALETLLGHNLTAAASNGHRLESDGAD
jgi:Fe-S cluster biogenesis protein NfuA